MVATGAVDLDGQLRIQGLHVDIGAYEAHSTVVHTNSPPTVAITSPANGASFQAPAKITLAADASDSDGIISQVQFFAGATLLGTVTNNPYTLTLLDLAANDYSFTAVAKDNDGATSTSAIVKISVTNAVAPPATNSLIYTNAFSVGGVRNEWSNGSASSTVDTNKFLGSFYNETNTLTLTNLAAHANLILEFDLYLLSSWNGNDPKSPNIFDVRIGNGPVLLHTTFNNGTSALLGQAYPDAYPGGNHPALTGAIKTNTLGFPPDSVYHLSYTFPHQASTLVVVFSASGLDGTAGAGWGLDNLQVRIAQAPLRFGSAAFTANGGFQFQINGPDGAKCDVQTSDRLTSWTSLTNLTITGGSVLFIHSQPGTSSTRFYRAVLTP